MRDVRLPASALLALTAGLLCLTPALAGTAQHRDPMILHLSPSERVEQRCNARAMGVIQREHKGMRPDEMVAYAFSTPKVDDDSIDAPGAAVRSRGHWFHVSYHCRTVADGMDIKSFSYTLGAEVPKSDWSAHYLVP